MERKKKRAVSLEERQEIQKMLSQGCTYEDIANNLKRCKSTITYDVNTRGGRHNYQPNIEKDVNRAITKLRIDNSYNQNGLLGPTQFERFNTFCDELDKLKKDIFDLFKEVKIIKNKIKDSKI